MGNVTWRAVRVQQARVKSGQSPLCQTPHGSTGHGPISDSQADSAGSIPVTRSILEYPCSTIEWDAVSQVEAVPVRIRFALRAVTCNYRVPSRPRWRGI